MSGPRWARALTDANALAGVISFVAAFWWDGVIVAVFAPLAIRQYQRAASR